MISVSQLVPRLFTSAIANAGRAVIRETERWEQRDRLRPGARADGPGHLLDAVDADECWDLLATQPIGRVSFTAQGGLPVIVPVNYAVDGETIVFRTGRGPKLTAATRGEVVAFEADEIDMTAHAGWSVVVIGRAAVVTSDDERGRLASLGLQPWAAGPRDEFVVITPRNVAGRRLHDRTFDPVEAAAGPPTL
jgi:nitroimidazol reductase NimA-like FMN-containing flavoprotein (pyridoxamine 5'-phosphate oxidase superfamily)